jgi:hypothetical protein
MSKSQVVHKLGRFDSAVFSILLENPRLTAGEIFDLYKDIYPNTLRSRNEVAKRLSKLQNQGLVEKGLVGQCYRTMHSATTWVPNRDAKVELSQEPAEDIGPKEDVDATDDIQYDIKPFNLLSKEEKIKVATEMLGGEVVSKFDEADLQTLADLKDTLNNLDANPLAKILLSSIPGMKGQAERLKTTLNKI